MTNCKDNLKVKFLSFRPYFIDKININLSKKL